MRTEWPAPAPEADVLAYVHHRARVIGVRRRVVRTVPALVAVLALAASLVAGDDGRPASLRVADDGTAAEGGDEATPRSGGGHHGDGDGYDGRGEGAEDPPQLGITPRPVSDDPVEVRTPRSLPLVPQPSPLPKGARVVEDPHGDDSPHHDAVDLRYGDIAYRRPVESLRFTLGVTDLSRVPVGVSYAFSFLYDDLTHSVSALRREAVPTPVVHLNGSECRPCSVAYEAAADEVRIDVPLAVLNERIVADSTATWSAAWPTGHRQSPPLAEGSTMGGFRLNAHVYRGGPLDGSDETQPHDRAESDRSWTLR